MWLSLYIVLGFLVELFHSILFFQTFFKWIFLLFDSLCYKDPGKIFVFPLCNYYNVFVFILSSVCHYPCFLTESCHKSWLHFGSKWPKIHLKWPWIKMYYINFCLDSMLYECINGKDRFADEPESFTLKTSRLSAFIFTLIFVPQPLANQLNSYV